MEINPIELRVLILCQELIQVKQKFIKRMARMLGIEPQEIFYAWLSGTIPQHGHLPSKKWKYFFHGFECDLRHCGDGRMIRIEFGPGGRIDTFTDWGIFQYLISSKSYWFSKPEVIQYFSAYHEIEDYQKISVIVNKLKSYQWVVPVASKLHEPIHFSLLPTLLAERKYLDSRVCHRLIVSSQGWELLSQIHHTEENFALT